MITCKLVAEDAIGVASVLVPISAAKSVALLSLPRFCLLPLVYLLRTPFIRNCCLASRIRNRGFTLRPGRSLCQQTTQAPLSLSTQHRSGRLPLSGSRLFCMTVTASDFCACCLACSKVLQYDVNCSRLRSQAKKISISLVHMSGVHPSQK